MISKKLLIFHKKKTDVDKNFYRTTKINRIVNILTISIYFNSKNDIIKMYDNIINNNRSSYEYF